MLRDEIETVETTSPNLLVEQTEQLKLIFPQVFSEGKIDFKKLRVALGDVVDTQPERYSFTWLENATQRYYYKPQAMLRLPPQRMSQSILKTLRTSL